MGCYTEIHGGFTEIHRGKSLTRISRIYTDYLRSLGFVAWHELLHEDS
ncbi:MAG: hypothetical protein AB8B52_04440 [Winogradskyella sp.]